jgi:HEAT repeat protein
VEPTWLEALNHPDNHIRWHGARGLGNIGDAKYADTLAEGLLDENQAVRWATADVLAQLGAKAVPATLTIISQSKLNEQSRQAAYHALHGITSRQIQERIKPLLDALHGPAASIEAPAVAQRLLMEWEKVNNV